MQVPSLASLAGGEETRVEEKKMEVINPSLALYILFLCHVHASFGQGQAKDDLSS